MTRPLELARGPVSPLPFYRAGVGYRALLDPAVFLVARGAQLASPPRPVESINFDAVLRALRAGETVTLAPLRRFPWRGRAAVVFLAPL